jgi:hypothetical protein
MTKRHPTSSSSCQHICAAEYVAFAFVHARMQNSDAEMYCIHSATFSSEPVIFVVTLPPIGFPVPSAP